MAECRYYRVAGHLFGLEADGCLLDTLSNYAPFRVIGDKVDGKVLFRVRLDSQLTVKDEELSHVFTDMTDDDMPRIEVYKTADEGWHFRMAMTKKGETCCYITPSKDITCASLYIPSDSVFAFAFNNAAMLLYAFATSSLGTLEMHAAVIKRKGKGYLFLGKSGTGKSTHARQWLAAYSDCTLLNDDNPILRVVKTDEGDKVYVYGSPWSGKTSCYINDYAEVGGVVKLSQAPKNEARRLRLSEAYAYILSSASGMKIVPEVMDAIYETIARMLNVMPVFALDCLPNADAAHTCWKAINE